MQKQQKQFNLLMLCESNFRRNKTHFAQFALAKICKQECKFVKTKMQWILHKNQLSNFAKAKTQ